MEQLLLNGSQPGVWGRPVLTFQAFVEQMLEAGAVTAIPLDEAERRLLLQRVISRLASENALPALGEAADTEGCATHMLRLIRQLKQAAVEPSEFAEGIAARRSPSPLDADVSRIYSAYQEALLEAGAYDQEGLYWEATDLCARSHECPKGLVGIDALAMDGFDDYTPAQFRFLETITPHLNDLVFGLALHREDPSAGDLYKVPIGTADKIVSHFRSLTVQPLIEQEPETASQYGAKHIFWRTHPPGPKGLRRNVQVTPCTTAMQEVETIARRVKALILDEGVEASDIAVVYRDLGAVADSIRTIFGECGIPVRIQHQPSLFESALGGFVLAVFDALSEWDRDAVCDVINSSWFPDGGDSSAITTLAQTAQIIRGHREWEQRLDGLAALAARKADTDYAPAMPTMADPAAAIAEAQRCVQQLRCMDTLLGTRDTHGGFSAKLRLLLDQCAVEKSLNHVAEEIRPREEAARLALYGLLDTFETWYARADGAGPVSRSTFAQQLRRAFLQTPIALPQPHNGVACVDVEGARHLSFRHVFFAGVNESEVPRRPPLNAIYSDEDIRDLDAAGITLDSQHHRTAYEMLLFHRVIELATDKLWISFRRLSAGGKGLLPSPYLTGLENVLESEVEIDEAHRVSAIAPDLADVASWRDVRNAVFQSVDGNASPFSEDFSETRRGADVERDRHRPDPFGAYDAVLSNAQIIEPIAKKYGDDHCFSVSQLETYVDCPFRFFMQRLLGIDPEPVPVEEFDARVRGAILHEVLEKFHRKYPGVSVGQMAENGTLDAARKSMAALSNEVFTYRARKSLNAPPGVLTLEKRRVAALLDRYLTVESAEKNGAQWAPSHFEVSFGKARFPSDDPLNTTDPLLLETPAGSVQFGGKIDRVDRCEGQGRIIDYKTSVHTQAKDITEGRSLQLGVYALAYENLLTKDSRCESATFVQVGKRKSLEALGRVKKTDLWPERQEILLNAIADAVDGIRAGSFHPTSASDTCHFCPSQRPCRHDARRMERKVNQEGRRQS
jgi:ATP-dependent helicase/DNAse subunit B